MKKFREDDRSIIYLDETWVDNDLTFKKLCTTKKNINCRRFIVVHAGSENGFVQNAALVFKAGLTQGDYHGQMNQENFTKWLTEKLLPNIPEHSVIVMDNAPYHFVQEDKVPTKSALETDIIAWLTKKVRKGIN
ncbi:hypothetical protein NQ315_000033 [Exocentrus adspersus]|uniref:Transposase n=1 Tax=Exocentrus adspersus TaxID=1586481 RepID=A0AAV8VFE0_9CUCU|nr:hypothetical protein NQ315_000033 [Exocentrus adspersus]